MKTLIILSIVLVLPLDRVENAKILSILPLPTPSHFVMFRKLFEELATAGHEIDVVTPLDEEGNVHGLNIIPIEMPDVYVKFKTYNIQKLRAISVNSYVPMMFADHLNLCELCFTSDAIKAIRDGKKKYDLIILEIFVTDCLFGFAHHFQAPVVSVTTSVDLPWGSYRIGNPDNPAYIPNYFSDFVPGMTILERLYNMVILVQTKVIQQWFVHKQEQEAKKFFGHDLPPLNDLIANSSLFLVNSHFSSNQARPSVPNLIEVAGLHIGQPKPLKKPLSDFIGNSTFIYFALGSLASSEKMSLEKLQMICNVLGELELKVLWKADKTKLPDDLVIPKNIFIVKWVPQLDVLCHKNLLFFITHNGLLGTQEAVYCGVPMLSIPAFSDQFLNAKTMFHKGLALELKIETASPREINIAMRELIENPKYKENAVKLSRQFKDRPRKPLEEAIYWIEYVLRYNGAPQLRSKSVDLAWYQYYLIDVSIIMWCLAIISSNVIYIILRRLVKLVFQRNVKQKLL